LVLACYSLVAKVFWAVAMWLFTEPRQKRPLSIFYILVFMAQVPPLIQLQRAIIVANATN